MRQKNKYLIKCWYQLNKKEETFEIYGIADKIWWNRFLKHEQKKEIITKFEITKIE